MKLRGGSLFTGCRGLDLGVELAGDVEWAWAAENDQACQRIIAKHDPDVPIIGDVREIDGTWGPVDFLVGGFPCQDLSYAGKGAGLDGDKSALWFAYADAIRLLRPRIVLVENVPGLATRGQGRVLYDLAEAGYVGSWFRLRASDVGAPHGRARVFIVARDASADTVELEAERRGERGVVSRASRGGEGEGSERERDGHAARDRGEAVADAGLERSHGRGARDEAGAASRGGRRRAEPTGSPEAVADSDDAGRGEQRGPVSARTQLSAAECRRDKAASYADRKRRGLRGATLDDRRRDAPGHDVDGRGAAVADADGEHEEPKHGRRASSGAHARNEQESDVGHGHVGSADWGPYAAAVARWEPIVGRRAPAPVDDRGRLAPEFVEWMLGYPADWTAGVSRTARLRMLGNSVQVQCATVAGRAMLAEANA